MVYKTINVDVDTFKKVTELSKYYKVSKYQLLATCIDFFDANKKVIDPDFFQKANEKSQEELQNNLSKSIKKNLSSDFNRVISFLKVQDKNMERYFKELKREILYKLDDSDELEYHPFFIDYDYIIDVLMKILREKGINNNDDILVEIKKILGQEEANTYMDSFKKVSNKKMIIE
jgi:hypothetical protein